MTVDMKIGSLIKRLSIAPCSPSTFQRISLSLQLTLRIRGSASSPAAVTGVSDSPESSFARTRPCVSRLNDGQ
eukprot:832071-Prymnesium_polylepis.1